MLTYSVVEWVRVHTLVLIGHLSFSQHPLTRVLVLFGVSLITIFNTVSLISTSTWILLMSMLLFSLTFNKCLHFYVGSLKMNSAVVD